MGLFVSMFETVRKDNYRYTFYLVIGDTLDTLNTKIMEELQKQFKPFATKLWLSGVAIMAQNTGEYIKAYQAVEAKDWPKKVSERIKETLDPFMLVLNRDFEVFNPNEHSWSIIWFSDFVDKPDRIYGILSQLTRKTRYGEDIFEYLRSIARKERLRKWTKCFKIKPNIFGISIDLKEIFEDII